MRKCYAEVLGDCSGRIEDEHFISKSIQKAIGFVVVSGLSWQQQPMDMAPGSYAHGRVICAKHHDDLDGLDDVALAYFRNFMLCTGQMHMATGAVGRIEDIKTPLDGRSIEKWFLKTVCGSMAANNITGAGDIPVSWIRGLFAKSPWPDVWSLYVVTGSHMTTRDDASFHLDYHWDQNKRLNGLVATSFSVQSVFAIEAPNSDSAAVLRRPEVLEFRIVRPDGSDILVGVPPGQIVEIELQWPS